MGDDPEHKETQQFSIQKHTRRLKHYRSRQVSTTVVRQQRGGEWLESQGRSAAG